MNPTYFFIPASRLVCLHYLTPATFEDWTSTMNAVLSDQEYSAGFSVLIDRRGIRKVPTRTEVLQTVHYFEAHHERLKRVASVVDPGATYGMGRMLEFLSDSTEVEYRVFSVYEEACDWLGLSPDCCNRESATQPGRLS